jgi:hypothetical protein
VFLIPKIQTVFVKGKPSPEIVKSDFVKQLTSTSSLDNIYFVKSSLSSIINYWFGGGALAVSIDEQKPIHITGLLATVMVLR